MEEEGIEPDTMSYNCALNGLAKCREWYRARRLFRKMGRDGLSRDVYSHNGLVEAAGMGSLSPRRNMIQVCRTYELKKSVLNKYLKHEAVSSGFDGEANDNAVCPAWWIFTIFCQLPGIAVALMDRSDIIEKY